MFLRTASQPPDTYGGGNDATNDHVPSCYRGAPVNCATGNQVEEQTDLVLGGRGLSLHLTRTYNSQAAAEAKEAGPWGYGWSGPYSSHLEFNEESGSVTVVQENGATAFFALQEGQYVPGAWVQATLGKSGKTTSSRCPTRKNSNSTPKASSSNSETATATPFTSTTNRASSPSSKTLQAATYGFGTTAIRSAW